jgi:hypothetical protein
MIPFPLRPLFVLLHLNNSLFKINVETHWRYNVTLKNAVFLDVRSYGSRSLRRLLVMAKVFPSSPIFVTLKMKELRSFETSILTGTTPCNIPEDGIIQSHCSENLKSYMTSPYLTAVLKLSFERVVICLTFTWKGNSLRSTHNTFLVTEL